MKLIDGYKFRYTQAAAYPLARLLAARMHLPLGRMVIVPIPTAAKRIRARGYDHTALLAQRLAKVCGVKVEYLLMRNGSSEQKTAGRSQRYKQASVAYSLRGHVRGDTCYLILDDVITTGATVGAAAQLLRQAGARDVQVVALAWQPLDEV